ncbi:MAG: glycosyltransferase family 39 protein [Chloroflexota bacterium]
MQLTHKHKLTLLIIFYGAWGLVLGMSIARYGLGVSSDSVAYLFAGKNLFAGQGLTAYSENPFVLWPPVYPVLLGLVHSLTGIEVFHAAILLQFLAYGLASAATTLLLRQIFPQNFAFALLGCIVIAIGPVVTITFQLVGTDYLHLALVLACLFILGQYARTQATSHLWRMALLGGTAGLLRYTGLAVILTGAILVFIYTSAPLRRRLARSFWTGLAALPTGARILAERFIFRPPRREPIEFSRSLAQYSGSILEWFTQAEVGEAAPLLVWTLWGIVAALVVFLLAARRVQPVFVPESVAILGYGLVYTILLLGISSQTYVNRLIGRFVLPVYAPLILLVLLATEAIIRLAKSRLRGGAARIATAGVALALLLAFLPIGSESIATIRETAANGAGYENIYNSREWNENGIIRFIKENPLPENARLFSNYQAGIAFHTWQTVYPSPRKFSNPYSDKVIPLKNYRSRLFAKGVDTYLIWIEPNFYEHVYEVGELTEIARIVPILENEDGGIYRLIP